MDANFSLERFCYLGTLLPYYVHKREPVKQATYSQISTLITQVDGVNILKIIEKCMEDENLPRKDEVWFIYAAYLTNSSITANDRKPLKQAFINHAKTASDLFLFVKYAKDLLKEQNRKNFSGPVKDVIKLWYAAQDNNKLIDMMSINRGLYNFEHKDLIKMCHINLKKIGKPDIEKYLFQRSNKFIKENENKNDNKVSKSVKKLTDICKLRTTTDINAVKEMIKEKKMKYEHVPKHFLRRVDIWEALLPTISYRQLLKNVHFIVETKMMCNASFSKAYIQQLSNRDLMRQEKLHPIFFLIERSKQLKQMRYSEKIKQTFHTKKITKLNIKSNVTLNKTLTKVFGMSFDTLQPIGLRIFITLNLQENYKKKVLCNHKQITCMEAAITLAFSYFKNEKKTSIFTYSSDSSKLEPIPWTKDCNFKKANEICEGLVGKKNVQKTYLPIVEATKKTEQYDLFLIIVPSAARGNPHYKPTKVTEVLEMYRKAKNNNARVVFVNLRRFKPAMEHESTENNGILEICGFDENTPKLINAFALKQFS